MASGVEQKPNLLRIVRHSEFDYNLKSLELQAQIIADAFHPTSIEELLQKTSIRIRIIDRIPNFQEGRILIQQKSKPLIALDPIESITSMHILQERVDVFISEQA